MKLNIPTRYLILALIIVLSGLFFYGWHLGHKKAESALNPLITSQNEEIRRYMAEIDDKTTYIASREQKILSQRQAIRDGEITREELRKLNLRQANEISKLKFRIDTLLDDVANSGGVIIIHDTITNEPKNYVKLPFVVTKDDQWLSLKDSTDISGKTYIALSMEVGVDVITGTEKKTKTPIISIKTDNPYINVIGIRSYKTDTNKPNKWGIGAQIGYGFILSDPVKASPYIGVGLSRSIIRF